MEENPLDRLLFVVQQLLWSSLVFCLTLLLLLPRISVVLLPIKLPLLPLIGFATGAMMGGFWSRRIRGSAIGFVAGLIPAVLIFMWWFWALAHAT